jgi:hypothetical protein
MNFMGILQTTSKTAQDCGCIWALARDMPAASHGDHWGFLPLVLGEIAQVGQLTGTDHACAPPNFASTSTTTDSNFAELDRRAEAPPSRLDEHGKRVSSPLLPSP